MRLSSAVRQFIDDARPRLARATLIAYESDLNLLVSLASVEASDTVLSFNDALVRSYLRKLSEKNLTMATLHRRCASLAEFGRWGVRRRLWSENPMDLVDKIKRPRSLPRPFSAEERRRLMELPLTGQERALRAVLYFTGLRATPICGIRIGDCDFWPRTMTLPTGETFTAAGSIRTVGKGSKPFECPMHPALRDILYSFVLEAHPSMRPQAFLFTRRDGGPITRKVLGRRTHSWGVQASVRDCEPHRFRHTFATALVEHGTDIRLVQVLMNHADLNTTQIYTKVADAQAFKAVLNLPVYGADNNTRVMCPGSVPPPQSAL